MALNYFPIDASSGPRSELPFTSLTISQVPQPAFFQELINKLILKPGSLESIDLTATDMIPFAGFLLEYPYVYVASAMHEPLLAGVSLFVYDCTVNLCGKW